MNDAASPPNGRERAAAARKITDVFAGKPRTFSCEFFPPKDDAALGRLYRTAETLAELGPDFFSVTYGAGGSTSRATMDIIVELQKRLGISCMHHLTLVGQRREDLAAIIRRMIDGGVANVLALRGDPPPEMGNAFRKVDGGLEYCYELIDLIREVGGGRLAVGVAGFPEGHVDCPSKELDTQYLKLKLDHGGEFVVTQLFFENTVYAEYLDRTAGAGVRARIIPGVLPITDYKKLLRFCRRCGASVSRRVHDIFEPIQDAAETTRRKGIDFAVEQCADLLRRGAPGLHFYSLNSVEPVRTIWRELRKE